MRGGEDSGYDRLGDGDADALDEPVFPSEGARPEEPSPPPGQTTAVTTTAPATTTPAPTNSAFRSRSTRTSADDHVSADRNRRPAGARGTARPAPTSRHPPIGQHRRRRAGAKSTQAA
ncbi:hypothetical protein GCM10010431_48710 [Streptomyces kunmingensis]|uniref:hypothetical protein n=1 Tax=Streptomyces kunmingensis TaxID=68225 RepID=UPI0033899B81